MKLGTLAPLVTPTRFQQPRDPSEQPPSTAACRVAVAETRTPPPAPHSQTGPSPGRRPGARGDQRAVSRDGREPRPGPGWLRSRCISGARPRACQLVFLRPSPCPQMSLPGASGRGRVTPWGRGRGRCGLRAQDTLASLPCGAVPAAPCEAGTPLGPTFQMRKLRLGARKGLIPVGWLDLPEKASVRPHPGRPRAEARWLQQTQPP